MMASTLRFVVVLVAQCAGQYALRTIYTGPLIRILIRVALYVNAINLDSIQTQTTF